MGDEVGDTLEASTITVVEEGGHEPPGVTVTV